MYRAGLPSPGARLLAAAKLVRPGRAVADIGCDHGKLAVYLALSGVSPKVVAIDKRPMPLAGARALVAQTGCTDKVDCRLGDGLAPLAANEVQDVVIAGMSGQTMLAILSAAPWIKNKEMHFVFVPATRAQMLRCWLLQNGFALLAEQAVAERGHFYTVMSVGYTGVAVQQPAPLLCELGLLANARGEAAAGYVRQRLRHLQKRANAPLPVQETQQLQNLIQEVERCLTQNKCGST